jgi:hypothetical protein
LIDANTLMKDKVLNRSWISPFTAVSFAVVAVTGVLLLVHIKGPAIKNLHQWVGLAFAVAGIVHLLINWRALAAYFRQRAAIAGVIAGIVVSLASLLAGGGGPPHHDGRPPRGQQNGGVEAERPR